MTFPLRLTPTASISASADAGTAAGTATVRAVVPFALSDWDTTGLEVEAGALIEAAAPANIFQRAPRTVLGSLLEGEFDLDSDGTEITRISWTTGTSQLRLFDSDTSFDINAFFASGGAGHDLTLRFQTTADNAVEVNVEDAYVGGNPARAHFDVGTAMTALLNTVSDGDHFIIGLYRAEAPPTASASGAGDAGTAGGTATVRAVLLVASASGAADAGTAAGSMRVVATELVASASGAADAGTAGGSMRVVATGLAAVSGAADAGTAAGTLSLRATQTSGSASITAAASAGTAAGALRLQATELVASASGCRRCRDSRGRGARSRYGTHG